MSSGIQILENENSDPRERFALLFRKHLSSNTGLEEYNRKAKKKVDRWTYQSFVDALHFYSKVSSLEKSTFESWYNIEKPQRPQREKLEAILEVFFSSPNCGDSQQRAQMEAAWRAGQHASRERQLATEDLPAEWVQFDQLRSTELAEVWLHVPEPTNQNGIYLIPATLRIGDVERDHKGREVRIRLRSAYLLLDYSPAHPPVAGSLIGERSPHSNFSPRVGGLTVSPNDDEAAVRAANLFGEDHLVTVSSDGQGAGPMIATLVAPQRCFEVTDQTAGRKTASANRDAILNVFLHKKVPKDTEGRVVLARSKLERKIK